MEEEGFFVINYNTKSRISEAGSLPSNIDLMFSSEDIFELITYKQEEDTWGSDHYPIEYNIKISKKRYIKIGNRITTKRTDWTIYQKEIKNKEDILRSKNFKRSYMQYRYRIIVEIMKNAVKEATKKKENKIKNEGINGKESNKRNEELERKSKRKTNIKNPVSWWDEECRAVIEERKTKLTKYQETLDHTDFIEYKKARAIARKTIKQKKKEDFKRFATSFNKTTNLKYVWQKMKVLKKGFNTIDWNKWNNKDRKEEIEKEIDKIAPPWVKYEEETTLDLKEKENSIIYNEETNKEQKKQLQDDMNMNKDFVRCVISE